MAFEIFLSNPSCSTIGSTFSSLGYDTCAPCVQTCARACVQSTQHASGGDVVCEARSSSRQVLDDVDCSSPDDVHALGLRDIKRELEQRGVPIAGLWEKQARAAVHRRCPPP